MTAIFHDQSFVERNMREKKYFLLFNHRRMSTIILPSLQLLHIKIDDGNVRVYFYCQLFLPLTVYNDNVTKRLLLRMRKYFLLPHVDSRKL